jgi:hypothetical protein
VLHSNMSVLATSYAAPPQAPAIRWRSRTSLVALLVLSFLTLLVHGYHPLAEDGGLYVAGIQYTLNPSLFPHYTDFVREHLRFSLFAPLIAALVRLTHLTLPLALLLIDLFSIWLTLFAGLQILRRVVPTSDAAQLTGVALLAAWWTMPVAGTSLLLMDPYVTARSLSTPLSLLSIAFALDDWRPEFSRAILCLLNLCLAATLHPLMAAYAISFVIVLRCSRLNLPLKTRTLLWLSLASAAFIVAAVLQSFAPAESPAAIAAAITRYYWFLSQWQWYELLGLAGPPAMLTLILLFRANKLSASARSLCHTSLVTAAIVTFTALLFAHESYTTHLVARLQVLRIYLLLYAVMTLLLGATLFQLCDEKKRQSSSPTTRRILLTTPAILIITMAAIMGFVQRQSFPASPHVELPRRPNPNPWVQAFLWAKTNTPNDALFALDAKYVNEDGEDAQTFRATALRSALPDYSKDGGEASITPALAPQWQQGAAAQKNLSQQSDTQRDANLMPFHVTWMVLHSAAVTSHPCPYNNGIIKVCQLAP